MSSIRTFCVRWVAMIGVIAAAAIPVSQAVADEHPPPAATEQEAARR